MHHALAMAGQKGNPSNITRISDLSLPGVKVTIDEPAGPAIEKHGYETYPLENMG